MFPSDVSSFIAAVHGETEKKRRRNFSAEEDFRCIDVHNTIYPSTYLKERLYVVSDHSPSASVDESELRLSSISSSSSSFEGENDPDTFEDSVNTEDAKNQSATNALPSKHDFIPREMRTPLRTKYGKIPRLLKNDIRRFYPNMLVNTLNSQDHSVLSQFLKKFFLPDATLQLLRDLSSVWYSENSVKENTSDSTAIDPASNNREQNNNVVLGRDNLFLYFLLIFREFPDWCLSLQHVEIKRCNYRRSCQVVFRLLLSWTETIAVTEAQSTSSASSSHATKVEDLTSITTETKNISNYLAHQTNKEQESQQLQTRRWETIKYEVLAAPVMELNEDWRISHIESLTLASNVTKLALLSL